MSCAAVLAANPNVTAMTASSVIVDLVGFDMSSPIVSRRITHLSEREPEAELQHASLVGQVAVE